MDFLLLWALFPFAGKRTYKKHTVPGYHRLRQHWASVLIGLPEQLRRTLFDMGGECSGIIAQAWGRGPCLK